MGQSNSRRLSVNGLSDSLFSLGDGSFDPDTDRSELATVLTYLIRSGVVHLIQQSDDDSDESTSRVRAQIPKCSKYKANTELMDKSEFKIQIQQSSGMTTKNPSKRKSENIIDMINKRSRGLEFTRGQICYINNHHLPNKVTDTLGPYPGKAFTSVFSKNGDKLLTGSQDKFIRIYDTSKDKYKLIQSVQGQDVGWSIIDAAFSPEGNMFAYSSWSETLNLYNLYTDSHEVIKISAEDTRFCIFSLTFSQDSSEILAGASDSGLHIYNLERKKRVVKIAGHSDDVNAVSFADDASNILYSGGDDGLCKVWDRRLLNESSPEPVGVLVGHRDGITFIDSKGDGRHFISNSKDQTIKLWDIRKFSDKESQVNAQKVVESSSWDYRRENVPSEFSYKTPPIKGDSSVMTYRGHTVLQTLIRCRFSPAHSTGQRFIYTGCGTGRIVVYDVLTGKVVSTLSGHKRCVRDVAWHPYKGEIVSASWDCTVKKWGHITGPDECKAKDAEEEFSSNASGSGLRRSARLRAAKARKQKKENLARMAEEEISSSDED